jgi:hypothetical protein
MRFEEPHTLALLDTRTAKMVELVDTACRVIREMPDRQRKREVGAVADLVEEIREVINLKPRGRVAVALAMLLHEAAVK